MDVDLIGVRLHLHPSGAVYWQDAKSLLLADLHLGKESVFQQSGLAVPSGATCSTLETLQLLVEEFMPERVIVLGDLLHAKVGLTTWLEQQIASLVIRENGPEWILIPGNHDRGASTALRRCGWSVEKASLELRGVWLKHAPENSGNLGALCISGHLHPSIRISLTSRERTRLRCYWLHDCQLILPAFGGWTGTHPIVPVRGDRVFACVERDVIELVL
jgi:DNA ligase-associated metallophosphoesterase